jgi:hypothetical protein
MYQTEDMPAKALLQLTVVISINIIIQAAVHTADIKATPAKCDATAGGHSPEVGSEQSLSRLRPGEPALRLTKAVWSVWFDGWFLFGPGLGTNLELNV